MIEQASRRVIIVLEAVFGPWLDSLEAALPRRT
jgi:hypothetical protein